MLDCSRTNLTSLTDLQMPNQTMWLIASYDNILHLDWSKHLDIIQHFDLQKSSIQEISDDFFTKTQAKFLNLKNNGLKSLPKSLNGTNFSEVYLAGNPIDCNCDMMWFADWLNRTNPVTGKRVVRDYDKVICEGGKWAGRPVYLLNLKEMGCYPRVLAKYVVSSSLLSHFTLYI